MWRRCKFREVDQTAMMRLGNQILDRDLPKGDRRRLVLPVETIQRRARVRIVAFLILFALAILWMAT